MRSQPDRQIDQQTERGQYLLGDREGWKQTEKLRQIDWQKK